MGLSIRTAELLSTEYEVSLMASLCRLVDTYPQKAALVLWSMKNKPSDIKKKVPENQLPMPGFDPTRLEKKKLRVVWSYGKLNNIYIPAHKSIPEDSSVYDAWNRDQFTSGEEKIPFGTNNEKAIFENKSVWIKNEKSILSLIR